MLNAIISIVKEASQFFYKDGIEIHNKVGTCNYVTSADIQVEKFLKEKLSSLIPDSGFIGEEGDFINPDHTYVWVVDPIDGTSNFIRQLNLSCISVGLIKNGEPHMGVIYNPYTDELYTGEAGKGAFYNGCRLHVSDTSFSEGLFYIGFCQYEKANAIPCFRIFERVFPQCEDMRRLGSAAIELSTLAAGKAEFYFEIKLNPWDYAAAMLFVREAGGYIGTPFLDKVPFDKSVPIVAANTKENFDKLMEIVREELKDFV